jgi:hypothetical protein
LRELRVRQDIKAPLLCSLLTAIYYLNCYLLKEVTVLVSKGVPRGEIEKLKVGDFFMDGEIVNIQKKSNLVTIVTGAKSVFHAHNKTKTFNVFKKVKREQGTNNKEQKTSERIKPVSNPPHF